MIFMSHQIVFRSCPAKLVEISSNTLSNHPNDQTNDNENTEYATENN